jgi:hypothetical protein
MYPAPAKKPKRVISKKGLAAEELIQSGKFGCNTNQVAELVSILLGEKIEAKKERDTSIIAFVKGAVIVPVENNKSHSYEIGKPTYVAKDRDDECIKLNGTIGNHMPACRSDSRPATKEEIITFYREYMKHVNLLE